MNSPIGSKALRAQLDQLKSVVRDFAAREEQSNAAFRDQSAKEHYAYETKDQQRINETAKRVAAEVDAFEMAKQQWHDRAAEHKKSIDLAHSHANQKAQGAMEAKEKECRFQAQQEQMQAEQQRDAELGKISANWQGFLRYWDETTVAFQTLEQSIRTLFGGYGMFRKWLGAAPVQPEFSGGRDKTLEEFQRLFAKVQVEMERFGKQPLPRIFRFVPVWLVGLLLAGLAAAPPVLLRLGNHSLAPQFTIFALAGLVVVMVVYGLGWRLAAPLARIIAGDFIRIRQLLETGRAKAENENKLAQQQIEENFQRVKQEINQNWKRATKEISQRGEEQQAELSQRAAEVRKKREAMHLSRWQVTQQKHQEILTTIREENEAKGKQLSAAHEARLAGLERDFQNGWQALATDWQARAVPLVESIKAATATAQTLFPGWTMPAWEKWTPPEKFVNAVPFGQLEVDLDKFIGGLPKDARLALPCPATLTLPLLLTHPQQGSLLLETGKEGGLEAVGVINSIILRLLATTPPGRLEFTIFDPVGLGQNFASFMHLADYQASTINSRIWTQTAQFEEKLSELNEHMEKIIQMYLRNEYATITEYNAEAGSIAEKYHFLVIASFPVNFSDTAAKRLRNIAANGARCGVFTLIQWDQRNAAPQDFVPDELRNHSACLVRTEKGFELTGGNPAGTRVNLDTPPSAELTTQLLRRIGSAGVDSNRVEVPFSQIAPTEEEIWTNETTNELRVPIGRSGATKWQYLAIGRDTRQHVLVAGKTGSGKSTLFHIIITNLALRCSPEQVEFYLVDFKKGVEFKCYGAYHLPQAKVVAIESDRSFGLSVLQRVDEELRRRGDLFRQVGAQDLAGYKRNGGTEPVPRTLLLIDEFQEFFVEDDRVSQNAAVLLDRIVRQGRAFGIHVLLGSQTLGGAYTLARATLGQMVIRIALQCNEADAYLIMDQDNPAPRLLSRPGEGIYNDTAGSIEGNSPFQAVWLSDRVREEYLVKIRARADQSGHDYPGPIVFEGNAPADVRDNHLLNAVLKGGTPPMPVRFWLGAPNSIKDPTAAVFRRQSAANLLVVGQSDERGMTILSLAMVALAAQYSPEGAQFYVLHNVPAGLPQLDFFQRVVKALPQTVTPAGNSTLAEVMGALSAELKRRQEAEVSGPDIFVMIHDLQNFKKLRQEDEFSFSASTTETSPASVLQALITEGPARGMHVIVTCDSYGNVSRFMNRKTVSEFEMRVVFQMSAGDSASLIDAPDAAKLGLHRAILFNDREGTLETFRPYALPENDWVAEVARQLRNTRPETIKA